MLLLLLLHGMEWSSRHSWCVAGKCHPVFYGKMIYLIPDSHQLLLWQGLVLVPQQSLQSQERLQLRLYIRAMRRSSQCSSDSNNELLDVTIQRVYA